MLLLCTGPDTFRAQERAHELLSHFVQKYDAAQTSVERLEGTGAEVVERLIERINTASLFSPRRFLLTRNLLTACPKAKQVMLAQVLSRNPDDAIVVSIEEEPPAEAILRVFSGIPKFTRYDFPFLQGASFITLLQQLSQRLAFQDEAVIKQIAEQTEGDTWAAWNELVKASAGGLIAAGEEKEFSVYDLADAFLQARPTWRADLARASQTPQAMQAFLSQIRAWLRVRDGAAQTLPSFIVRKLQSWRLDERTEERFARVLLYYFLQRSGLATDEEAQLLLP